MEQEERKMTLGSRGPNPDLLREGMEIDVVYGWEKRSAVILELDKQRRKALVEIDIRSRRGWTWEKRRTWVKFKTLRLKETPTDPPMFKGLIPSSKVIKLIDSKATAKALNYFCEYERGTAKDIIQKTGLPEASVYRALKKLENAEVIATSGVLPRKKVKGGPRETVWKLK